jgi:hypothetical protein
MIKRGDITDHTPPDDKPDDEEPRQPETKEAADEWSQHPLFRASEAVRQQIIHDEDERVRIEIERTATD